MAQVNIAALRAPLESPQLAGFVNSLDPVNALADASPGFIWRLQTEAGDATAIRPFDDDRIIVNMSVWESFPALKSFLLQAEHRAVMQHRREFFERPTEAYVALWWIPAGALPSVVDAKDRIAHIRRHGPTGFAFDFRRPFPAPDADPPETTPQAVSDRTGCPSG